MKKLLLSSVAVMALAMMPASANVIFGDAGSIPGDCHQGGPSGAEGLLCAASETFANSGGGSVNAVEGGGQVLTDKPVATVGFMDSGLGGSMSGVNCDDAVCEAEHGQSVTVTANGTKITDAIVGSIDPTESFDFFVDGVKINASPIMGVSCSAPDFASVGPLTCQWTDPTGNGADSIRMVNVAGSTVVSEISTPSAGPPGIPEPSTLGVLGMALAFLFTFGYKKSQVD